MLLLVKRRRLELGLEQAEVARRVGVSPTALSRIERGTQLPWPALRARLSEFYGIPESELFFDVDRAQVFLREAAGEGLR